ncbi:DEAD-box ATP-dependent RNA helicase 24-like [Pyrus ussuriensis x Pyrus communis]|uniref:DEAD-box ATP-dependent RNA helicase 24-like n=1 Tax=Pyrus ussuriensis x Pyrus communis TaxID=2448454 RepID=A0A5N5G975_9ROSA|nr:DEAD-box ATP-dependent RNA helicase 24-like [Pyrus ussuriensis x Pyrus communis]
MLDFRSYILYFNGIYLVYYQDGRFRSKRDSRKGGGKKGRGRGGGGRGVRGVDFGLGIGYNTESNSSSSNTVPSRSAAVTPQRTGMMSQFKTKFVAASSNSPSEGSGNNSSVPNRPALRGFVSGGSIGGDVYRTQTASTITPAPPTSVANKTAAQNTGENSVVEINLEKGGGAPVGTVNRPVELHHSHNVNDKFCFCCRSSLDMLVLLLILVTFFVPVFLS